MSRHNPLNSWTRSSIRSRKYILSIETLIWGIYGTSRVNNGLLHSSWRIYIWLQFKGNIMEVNSTFLLEYYLRNKTHFVWGVLVLYFKKGFFPEWIQQNLATGQSTNCQYLCLIVKSKEKNKKTLFFVTFKVWGNKMVIFFFHFCL